jgi:hypothetical protein
VISSSLSSSPQKSITTTMCSARPAMRTSTRHRVCTVHAPTPHGHRMSVPTMPVLAQASHWGGESVLRDGSWTSQRLPPPRLGACTVHSPDTHRAVTDAARCVHRARTDTAPCLILKGQTKSRSRLRAAGNHPWKADPPAATGRTGPSASCGRCQCCPCSEGGDPRAVRGPEPPRHRPNPPHWTT